MVSGQGGTDGIPVNPTATIQRLGMEEERNRRCTWAVSYVPPLQVAGVNVPIDWLLRLAMHLHRR